MLWRCDGWVPVGCCVCRPSHPQTPATCSVRKTTHDPAVAHAAAEVWSRRCDHRGKPIVEEPRDSLRLW